MSNELRKEKEQVEYLFLDLEWNQPCGTTELADREAIQIGIVAADAQLKQLRTFSRAIRLKNPDLLNSRTVKIVHMSESNIMLGRSREEVMEIVHHCFPVYRYLVVWTRDTYDLFRRDMKECGMVMPKHRVVVLQDVLGLITGNMDRQIRFTHALQCAEIEYNPCNLHYSKHDANYLYQLYTKCYRQYCELTKSEYCDTNTQTGKMHIERCRYTWKFRPDVMLFKPKKRVKIELSA